MKERLLYCLTWLSIFLLIPYMMSCAINGAQIALINKSFDVEKLLPVILSFQIEENNEKDTLKAQAVIARTNLYYEMKEKNLLEIVEEVKGIICRKQCNYVENKRKFWSYPHKNYIKSVIDTKGMILTHEEIVKMIPYHFCSAGKTREGEEVFFSREYSYLKSVDSILDKENSDYIYITYFSEEQLPGNVTINERDQAGYVLSLNIDGKILEGETFRQGMNLPSSNFVIEKTGTEYKVICRGIGHGVGFSQYGGNRLAEDHKNWKEILNIYFPEMSISRIENADY